MKVIVHGADGHMGQIVERLVNEAEDMELAAAVTPDGSGNDAMMKLSAFDGEADVVIDFSHHSAVGSLTEYCIAHDLPLVLATTGLTEEEAEIVKKAGESIAIFQSANMSVGVALVAKLVQEVAAKFKCCDIELVETHHNRKLDAPSGTAIMLADAAKAGRPELTYNLGRSGHAKREPNEMGINAVRMGNIVGTHEVMFGTNTQTITIKHEAHDRALFADGAIDAARFIAGKAAGIYNMDDLLG